MGKILKIGFPIALQDGLIQISFIVITIIANRRGLNDAAAVGIVEKVMSFLFLIPSSMLSTVSALGAQNIGAGKAERAKLTLRYAALIAVCFGTVTAITIQFITWEANIYEDMCGIAFLPESISASAGIFVPAESPLFLSYIIS